MSWARSGGFLDTTYLFGWRVLRALGLVAVPPLDDIHQDPQLEGSAISHDEFGALWLEHARPETH